MVGAATKFNVSPPAGTFAGNVFEQVKPLGSEPRETIAAVELLPEAFTRIENVLPGVAVSDELCNESDKDDASGGGFVPPVVPPPQETMTGNNTNTNELKITEKQRRRGRKTLNLCRRFILDRPPTSCLLLSGC